MHGGGMARVVVHLRQFAPHVEEGLGLHLVRNVEQPQREPPLCAWHSAAAAGADRRPAAGRGRRRVVGLAHDAASELYPARIELRGAACVRIAALHQEVGEQLLQRLVKVVPSQPLDAEREESEADHDVWLRKLGCWRRHIL